MAHPMKGAADASKSAKKSSMNIHGSTIEPGVQTVRMGPVGETGQRSETQKVPTRKTGGRVCDMDDEAPSKKRGDRPAFATGGAVKARKGATTVNVIVAPGAGAAPPPPMDMGPPPPPMPMGPPPGMDMGPPPGPMGPPPMGPPPGMPMRASGGRVAKKFAGGPHTGGGGNRGLRGPLPAAFGGRGGGAAGFGGALNPAAVSGPAPAGAPTGAIGTGMGAGTPPASGMLGAPTGRPRPGISGGVAPGAGGIGRALKSGGSVDKKATGGAIGTGLKGSAPSSGTLGRPSGRPRPGMSGGTAPGAGGIAVARKHGGKVDKDCSPQGDAGAGSGLGRLNKAKAAKHD